jgi:crotonobetainyl-CoA:carnitine CoA-transferase CaiB-like acyl-CoA transferase
MDEIVLETWDQHPLLIIGRMRDPVMRQTKKLLGKYRISPAPEFIEVDQREDFEHVESIISKLLKTTTEEPVILLAGTNIGSNKQLYE